MNASINDEKQRGRDGGEYVRRDGGSSEGEGDSTLRIEQRHSARHDQPSARQPEISSTGAKFAPEHRALIRPTPALFAGFEPTYMLFCPPRHITAYHTPTTPRRGIAPGRPTPAHRVPRPLSPSTCTGPLMASSWLVKNIIETVSTLRDCYNLSMSSYVYMHLANILRSSPALSMAAHSSTEPPSRRMPRLAQISSHRGQADASCTLPGEFHMNIQLAMKIAAISTHVLTPWSSLNDRRNMSGETPLIVNK